jgi:hypothetical protein
VVNLSGAGVYVFDTVTGTARKAADVGPFDVDGSTLFVAHGNTVTSQPVAGGATSNTMTVAGATELKWIEVAPTDNVLTMWTSSAPNAPTVTYLHTTLVNAGGAVVPTDLNEDRFVEWSPDGSYFVVHDYRGLRAIKADGTSLWGPIASPDEFPNDMEFSPDGAHILIAFGHDKTFSFDVVAKTWTAVAVQGTVSFANNGRFAATPLTPAGWDGRNQLGTIISDLAGHSEVLSKTGAEPELSPTGTLALVYDRPIGAVAYDDYEDTMRLVDLNGSVLYTLTHKASVFGRDMARLGSTHGNRLEGPRWSADGRFVVVGLSS